MESDWVTTSFESDPALITAHLVPESEPWETIRIQHEQHRPIQILGIFPSYLQMDARFYRAIRQLGMSSLALAEEQMQAGIALIEPLHIGGIVLTMSALSRCVATMQELCPSAQPYLQVVLDPMQHAQTIAAYQIFNEIHITPGIPVLYQCTQFQGTELFHATSAYRRETFPREVTQDSVLCPCGASTIIRRN